MIPISGLPGQIHREQPIGEIQQVCNQVSQPQEPEDSFLPSECLQGSELAIGDRGAVVRRDLQGKNFLLKETEHFSIYYLPDSEAEKDIEEIAEKREQAFHIISEFLGVEIPEKICIYLFPSDRESFCPTWGKTFAGRTIPEARMIGLAYIGDFDSYEKVNFGHELTHAMEYDLLTFERRVPPFLREGLADYLCLSGEDMHHRLSRFIHLAMVDSPFSITEEKLNRPEYMESASFVQFLIGAFGRQAYLQFYKETAILKKEELMPCDLFSDMMRNTFGQPLNAVENLWRETLKPYIESKIEPLTLDEGVKNLFTKMEVATQQENEQKILSLYSDDFYYRTTIQENELFNKHLKSCKFFNIRELRIYDLGTWTYGKTIGIITAGIVRNSDFSTSEQMEKRGFLAEKIWGEWRLNSKFIGGWKL